MRTTNRNILVQAVRYRNWPRVEEALHDAPTLAIRRVAADAALAHAILEIVTLGPAECCAVVRHKLRDSICVNHVGALAWRDAIRTKLFRYSIENMVAASARSDWSKAAAYGIALAAQTPHLPGQVLTLYSTLRGFVIQVGKVEAALATAFPEAESNPHSIAPQERETNVISEAATKSLGAVSRIVRALETEPAFDGLKAQLLRDVFSSCHWPTWRSLRWLAHSDEASRHALFQLSLSSSLPSGARAHIRQIAHPSDQTNASVRLPDRRVIPFRSSRNHAHSVKHNRLNSGCS